MFFFAAAGGRHLQDKGANPKGTDGRPPVQPDQDLGEHPQSHLDARHRPPHKSSPGEDIIPCLEE